MPTESGEVSIGPIRVHVDEEHVTRYRKETGFPETQEKIVPVAFPAVWLTCGEVSDAIRGRLAGEGVVPVHESQSFQYFAPLLVGESYDLTLSMRRETTPPRLVLNASVSTLQGDLRLHAEALLRIVPRPVASESAP